MATGIETAGLVLGAFPIVVKALSSYAAGCQKIRDMFHHREVLKKFALELEIECTKFQNTCENLLQYLVSPDEVKELLNPKTPQHGQNLWSSPNLRKQLETKLRERTIAAFLQSITGIAKVLRELNEKFPFEEGKQGSRKKAKKLFKTIKYVMLCEQHQGRISEVRQFNTDLECLSLQGRIFVDQDYNLGSKSQAATAVKFYLRIQQHATNLFTVLKEKLAAPSCSCLSPHDTGLQLELRQIDGTCLRKNDLRFRTFISAEAPQAGQNWWEADIEPVEEDEKQGIELQVQNTQASPLYNRVSLDLPNKSVFRFSDINFPGTVETPIKRTVGNLEAILNIGSCVLPNNKTIEALCKILFTTPLPEESYYGFLVDQKKRRHRVLPPSEPVCNTKLSTVSLQELFRRTDFYLSIQKRLLLALKLASSVLQLHSSGWLAEEWGSQDILFFESASGSVLFDNPMICRMSSPTKKTTWLAPCNRTLFSLGIVLIELYYMKLLDQCPPLNTQASSIQPTINENLRYMMAVQLVNSLYDEIGLYGDAVRRCIKGIDHRETSLDKEGFKEEVYRVVLCPLENAINASRS